MALHELAAEHACVYTGRSETLACEAAVPVAARLPEDGLARHGGLRRPQHRRGTRRRPNRRRRAVPAGADGAVARNSRTGATSTLEFQGSAPLDLLRDGAAGNLGKFDRVRRGAAASIITIRIIMLQEGAP